MPLDYDYIMGLPPILTTQSWEPRDTILYALGVGAAHDDPTSNETLKYVYEKGLSALPTMAVVLAYPGFWIKDPQYRLTWQKVLHGEQSIELLRPLPSCGEFRGETTIDEIYDKGADKGAVLYSSRRIYEVGSGDHIATVRQSAFLRGDGGFGGRSDGAPQPHPTPARAPDLTLGASTRPDQALLYRLSGDHNPLHADPQVAREGGFDRPILHGLATYGIVGHLLVGHLCGDAPERVRRMDVRFSAPVFPGEHISVSVWLEGDGEVAFEARVAARDTTVLRNGLFQFSA